MTNAEYLTELELSNFEFSDLIIAPKIIVKYLILENKDHKSFCIDGNERNLLIKILTAINVNINDCICLQTTDFNQTLNDYDYQKAIIFDNHFKVSNNQFATYHPAKMLENPILKKNAWSILQKIK